VSVLVVPVMEPEGQEWPSLGAQVVAWIERHLVFGPGDLRGQPARVDDEKRALIGRIYEVYPRVHEQAGRRRFKRCALSLRKGSAKTELAAWLAAAELHPKAPVRCLGWDDRACEVHGKVRRKAAACACHPIGGGVRDPFIPIVAYTEEQSEELCYGALKAILEESRTIAKDFDIGLERVMRVRGDGKALPVSTAPGPRDGARTTFQVFDETHRMALPRLKKAHQTMLANMPKRRASDAWSLETTTAYAPGELSIAEGTMHYAEQVAEGRVRDSRLFFFHRQASDGHDLTTPEGIKAAVIEASGPVAPWSDIDSIVAQWNDPDADRSFLERVWLNRIVRASERAFNIEAFKELGLEGYRPEKGALITLGFDGARYHDSTGIVGTDVLTGTQFVLGCWEQDPLAEEWEVPQAEVEQAVAFAFNEWDVFRMYCDPPYWETVVSKWAGEYGEKRVVSFRTNQFRKMADAVRSFSNAQATGELHHDGDARYIRHVGNCHRRELYGKDDEGRPLWVVYKDRHGSPNKIDLAVAGVLSWEARRAALAEGAGVPKPHSVYESRGLVTL
jgi:phage terminase large subunit-like protein